MKRWWLAPFGIVATWTVMAFVLSVNIYVQHRFAGRPMTFWHAVPGPMLDYLIWAALTPLIFWIAKLLPFTRPKFVERVLEHAVACAALSILHASATMLFSLPRGYWWLFRDMSLRDRLLTTSYSDVWMYLSLVVVWNLFGYQRKYHERELRAVTLQSQLADARLESLKSQLQPHFLFNTLNSISALMQNDPLSAEDMLVDLSSLLRHSLADSGAREHTVASEIQLLETYLRIEKRRFEDRLQIRVNVATDTLDALVPSLVLQPLVENAVRHGIAPLLRPGTLSITSATNANGKLCLTVSDDGAGFPADVQAGIGVANCRQRLRELYGDAHVFMVQSTPSKGVKVTIIIPLRLAAEPEEVAYENASHHR